MSCQIAVRVTPRSSRPGIVGWKRGADQREELEIRVAEAPTDGSANAAVITLLAKALGISKSDIEILGGHTSRHKRLAVSLDVAEVRQKLSG